MKIISIIPARGGSKGLPRKNILELVGKPLIAYSIEVALKSKCINEVIVSTEDYEIEKIAKKYGAQVIKRPEKYAKDETPMSDVLIHALKTLTSSPDMIVLLQPTSPLRKIETVNKAIKVFIDNFDKYDSLISIYEIEGKNGWIKNGKYVPQYVLGTRRQDMEPLYRECGTIYIFKPNLIEREDLHGKNIFPFIINNYEESIDIDTIDDLHEAKYFMELRNEK